MDDSQRFDEDDEFETGPEHGWQGDAPPTRATPAKSTGTPARHPASVARADEPEPEQHATPQKRPSPVSVRVSQTPEPERQPAASPASTPGASSVSRDAGPCVDCRTPRHARAPK